MKEDEEAPHMVVAIKGSGLAKRGLSALRWFSASHLPSHLFEECASELLVLLAVY